MASLGPSKRPTDRPRAQLSHKHLAMTSLFYRLYPQGDAIDKSCTPAQRWAKEQAHWHLGYVDAPTAEEVSKEATSGAEAAMAMMEEGREALKRKAAEISSEAPTEAP